MIDPSGRVLPDFLIIGEQKCGTTALRYNLASHERIAMVDAEVHFFNRPVNYRKGIDWYSAHFPNSNQLKGEKTPDYLSNELASERIAQALPGAKLIILIRDPVARAYSHWNHMMQNIERTRLRGWEKQTFEESLGRADDGLLPFSLLLKKGHYFDSIQRFTRYFPRNQIYIGIQERFCSDGEEELGRLFDFLGVSRLQQEPARYHVREYASQMSAETECQLVQYFAPSNHRLFEFLGDQIPEWRRP